MSVGLYSHTTRGTGTVLTAAIYNSDHQNHITNQNPSMTGAYSDNVAQMQLVTDPGGLGSEDLAASLAGELERLRFTIERITGKSQWYIAPDTDLATLATGVLGQLSVTNELTPAQITADQNNYAPTGHADAFFFRLSSNALRSITGLVGGAIGRIVCITNVGSNGIQLTNEDAGSTDINRFAIGDQTPILLNANESVLLRYDITTDRWRPMHSVITKAERILYDNATSGLTADNAQDAIDEVDDRVDSLETGGTLVVGTVQSTATGTAFDFTGIPSWVKKISILFDDVSLSGTDAILVQIGDSGGIESTGYVSGAGLILNGGTADALASADGFNIVPNNAGRFVSGIMTIAKITGNVWVASHSCGDDTPVVCMGGGRKTLSGVLDRVRITRSGTNSFDSGQVNIMYE